MSSVLAPAISSIKAGNGELRSDFPHPQQALEYNLTRHLADQVFRVLEKQLNPPPPGQGMPLFYAWPRRDRAVLIFDPASFKDPRALLETRFAERLAAGMGNRKVVITLHGALFVQVSYTPLEVGRSELEMRPLHLGQQPGPFHVPLGMTKKGALWLSLLEMDSVLIGGSRRMGKTRVTHGFIQALLRGGQAKLLLWDGKHGVEFGRYDGQPHTKVVPAEGLPEALSDLTGELVRRQALFHGAGVASLPEYNTRADENLPVLVPVVDELALIPDEIQATLAKLIALGGAFGIHPIVATQRPDAEHVQGLLKSNLSTRIALPVPDHQVSKIILGRTGAEKLPKIKGRMLLVWNAKLVEVQAFRIDLPETNTGTNGKIPGWSLLTLDEQELVKVAVQELDGWFKIRELAEITGQGRDTINSLAKQWEALGYLTPVQRNEHGHQLGRKVTEKLRAVALQPPVAEIAGSWDEADRAD
jgi:hypothetical protein